MKGLPKFTEVRMGILLFITQAKNLVGYDKTSGRFDQVLGQVQLDEKFGMATDTCGGVLVRSLDPSAETPIAMAHVPSFEMGMKMMPGATHAQVRALVQSPEYRRRIQAAISELVPVSPVEAMAFKEALASLYSPIFGPDLLVHQITRVMGTNIEVRIFGGRFYGRERIPNIVAAIDREFANARAASVVIEHSVLGLGEGDRIALVSPFAEESRDLVRPTSSFPAEHRVIGLDEVIDG